jgi:hypothetical protein
MTTSARLPVADLRPVLAIDVDGVLNACGHGDPPPGWRDVRIAGLRVRCNPAHGAQLLVIALESDAELAWCTFREQAANEHVSPLLGLPDLPWVPMAPGRAGLKFSQYRPLGVIKAIALAAWAGDRPVCWLEDEPDAGAALAARHRAPHLVIEVDERAGLQEAHLERARAWLAALRQPAP